MTDERQELPDVEAWDDDSVSRGPSADELFSVLADTARRRLLWCLLNDQRAALDELTDTLVGWRASEGGVVGPDERRRLRISLHHVHLPRLVDAGLVTLHDDGREIRLSSVAEPVRDVIRFSCRYERAVASTN